MSVEVNSSVEEEIPEAVADANEAEVQQVEESPQQKRSRNNDEYNWAEANRKMQELVSKNRDMEHQLSKLSNPPKPQEIDEIDKLADDDIITKAQARKMAERMARDIAKEAIREREAATVEDRLSSKFPDFADVVSRENIELLRQTEPELAMSLSHNPDPYAVGVAAYKLIKKLSIGDQQMPSREKEKAIKNAAKPVSVNSVTKASAIGNAHLFENGLTPELKKQLFKEMEEARKRS